MAEGERFVSNQAKLRKRTLMHAPILFLKVKNCLINSSAKRRWALSGVPLQRIALDFNHLAPNCFNSCHMAKPQAEPLKVYLLVFLSIHCCQVANAGQQEGFTPALTSIRTCPRICTAAAASVTYWVRKGKAGEGKRGEWEKVKETALNPSPVDVLIAACTRYSHCWPNPISPSLPLAKNKLALFR